MQSIHEYWRASGNRCIVTTVRPHTYRQRPPEQMYAEALAIITDWEGDGVNMPAEFCPDFGTISMAKAWGGRPEVTDHGDVFIHPVSGDLDEILAIKPGPNTDGEIAAELYHRLVRETRRENMLFRTPDCQGVLNTAAMIMQQEELMVAMLTDPDKVHAFLEAVCENNIRFLKDALAAVGHIDGAVWPFIWLPHTVGITITEDYMPLLSVEMYREFGIPYLKRIADEFGGVFIHCCGDYARHLPTLAEAEINILGLEFHHPYTTLADVQEHFDDIVLAPFLNREGECGFDDTPAFVEHCLGNLAGKNRLWLAYADSWPEVPTVREVMKRRGVEFDGFCA